MGSDGSFSMAKYAKTRLGGPVQKAAHEVELENEQRSRANADAYWRLMERYQGEILEGEYRNLNGSHFKIDKDGRRQDVSAEKQTLPCGQIWYPEVPRGQAGMAFLWGYPHYLDEAEYEKVKPVQVGYELCPVLHDDGSSSRAVQFKNLNLAMVDGRLDYVPVDGAYDPACEHYLVAPTGDVSMIPALQPALALAGLSFQDEALPEQEVPSGPAEIGFDTGLTEYVTSEKPDVLFGESMALSGLTDDEALSLWMVADAH